MAGWQNLIRYSPHVPWPKQALALSTDCEELLFGGSAGPGKSDYLLMAALQYVHEPDYSALILRRDYPRLSLAGAVMDRAKLWLIPRGVNWNEQQKTFIFPSGARIQFGYIDNPNDKYRYASAEYQFVGFDELTEFRLPDDETAEENPYLFMFSRLRRPKGSTIPLRFRAASNPGNIGHEFVRNRFVTDESLTYLDDPTPRLFFSDDTEKRGFIPGRIRDNPALDEAEYEAKLSHLPRVIRARLMAGDWTIKEDSIIDGNWFRWFDVSGEIIREMENGKPTYTIHQGLCERFATIDTAGTSKEKAQERKGKMPSYSCVGIWDYDRQTKRLFLRHVWRSRENWNRLKSRSLYQLRTWKPVRVLIENAHFGPALAEEYGTEFQTELVGPMLPNQKAAGASGGGAKLERAVASGLLTLLEEGNIYLPLYSTQWLGRYENELVGWTGLDDEPSDQIDMSSYAAFYARRNAQTWGGTISPTNSILRPTLI